MTVHVYTKTVQYLAPGARAPVDREALRVEVRTQAANAKGEPVHGCLYVNGVFLDVSEDPARAIKARLAKFFERPLSDEEETDVDAQVADALGDKPKAKKTRKAKT